MPLRRVTFRRLPCRARIFLADGLVDAAELMALHAAAAAAMQPGSGIAMRADSTGQSCEIPYAFAPVLGAVQARIAAALGFGNPPHWSFRYRHYRAGEAHPPHTDSYRIGGLGLVATALLWLGAACRGGETAFPIADPPVALQPRAGRLAVWLNEDAAGAPDPFSAHAGLPVTAGGKVTLADFVYAPPGSLPRLAALAPEAAWPEGVVPA